MSHLLPILGLLLVSCSDYGVDRVDDDRADVGRLEVDPAALDFGEVAAGIETTGTFTLTNTGTASVALDAIAVEGSAAFEIWTDLAGERVAPGEAVQVVVAFTPRDDADAAQAVVTSDAANPRLVVDLQGEGVLPLLVVDPDHLQLVSQAGEEIMGEVLIRNEGRADLTVEDLALQGEDFVLESLPLPVDLGPGEEVAVAVTFIPPAEGTVEGRLWVGSTAGDDEVAIEGIWELPCPGLAEAWNRGLLGIAFEEDVGLVLTNQGGEQDLCVDTWYVYLSDETQDCGAGDPDFDPADAYGEEGSLVVAPGERLEFPYGQLGAPSWWCVEETQLTDETTAFHFTGARLPAPLRDEMLAGDAQANDRVWAWMRTNPVMVVGRDRNWARLEPGQTVEVGLEVVNMGRVAGAVTVEQTIPAGFSAHGFSPSPDGERTGTDGSRTFWWTLSLDAAQDTANTLPTIYDQETLSYTIMATECGWRVQHPAPVATWTDASGALQESEGSPFVVSCAGEG